MGALDAIAIVLALVVLSCLLVRGLEILGAWLVGSLGSKRGGE